ncbi:hypothetical protein V8F20_006011 [Naviculisporaceae sp. PSN 640]
MVSLEGTPLFVKDLFEFVAAIIVVVGVPLGFYDANSRWSTRLLSNLAMDEDEMGYFTAFRRCWLWVFAMVHIPTVKVPRVPSVGTLIRAGDDGVWSSAMLLDERSPGGRAKDPVVSWVQIYEAFFREFAWALDRYDHEIGRDGAESFEQAHRWRSVVEGEVMKRYRKEAAFDVWKLKHRVSDSTWNRHTRSRWVWPFSVWRTWCIRNILYPVDRFWHSFILAMHAFFYTYESLSGHLARLSHELNTIDVELDLIPRVDRQLLYYPWRIYAKESSPATGPRSIFGKVTAVHQCETGEPPTARRPKDIRPTLVSCVRPLEQLYSMSTTMTGNRVKAQRRLKGDEKGQRLRIFDEVPAIKISEEDLGALCMVLGIETRGEPFLPSGRGALGHLLTSHQESGMNFLHLGYHLQKSLAHDRSAGSGYLTLFAKHLTCGCIPFGRSTTEHGITMIHTIPITPIVNDLIRRGGFISDANPPPGKAIWGLKSIRFLQEMPKNGGHNFYHEPYDGIEDYHHNGVGHQETIQASFFAFSRAMTEQLLIVRENAELMGDTTYLAEKDPMGSIYHIDSQTRVPYCCRKWSQVVTGIAFGGLVPLTTRRLARLVEFTVGGAKLEGKDMEAFRYLTKLVVDEFSAQTCGTSDDGVLLFGRKIINDIKLTLSGISVDFESEALGTDSDSARILTQKFGWLTTLLEALTAMVKEKERPSSPDFVVGGVFRRGRWKRDDVFEACANQIQQAYEAMVNANIRGEEGPRCGIAKLLEEPIKELEAKECEISAENCGTVARCIIMAWARMVRIVEWKDDISAVDQERADDDDRRQACNLMTLDELPDIALWE